MGCLGRAGKNEAAVPVTAAAAIRRLRGRQRRAAVAAFSSSARRGRPPSVASPPTRAARRQRRCHPGVVSQSWTLPCSAAHSCLSDPPVVPPPGGAHPAGGRGGRGDTPPPPFPWQGRRGRRGGRGELPRGSRRRGRGPGGGKAPAACRVARRGGPLFLKKAPRLALPSPPQPPPTRSAWAGRLSFLGGAGAPPTGGGEMRTSEQRMSKRSVGGGLGGHRLVAHKRLLHVGRVGRLARRRRRRWQRRR